jgi:hypothetical protein
LVGQWTPKSVGKARVTFCVWYVSSGPTQFFLECQALLMAINVSSSHAATDYRFPHEAIVLRMRETERWFLPSVAI